MKILVIAPHPDDELLGCGWTLLRWKNEGAILGWVIMTKISEDTGWSKNSVQERENEIETVQGTEPRVHTGHGLDLPVARSQPRRSEENDRVDRQREVVPALQYPQSIN